ncbi:MAG: hypothetical protein GF355_04950 [Candidatus Eisenbacteria bacterium]|nr:hypothetical protein [Candidatus Eisenbacteria bacterium]
MRDCDLVVQTTGRRALTLRELREGLTYVNVSSIYFHFWGHFLRPTFTEPEYNNDFASWAHWHFNDQTLAERLSVVNPADFPNLEALRQELVDIVEMRMDEDENLAWMRANQQFHFILSKIIVFDTGLEAADPRGLLELFPRLSSGSIYYHFIDARRRTPDHHDDFAVWLRDLSEAYRPLWQRITAMDPYFSTLPEIKEELITLFQEFFRDWKRGEKGGRHV